MNRRGVKIQKVFPHSAAFKAGIKEGDRVISINGHYVKDALDIMFHSDTEYLNIFVLRGEERLNFQILRDNTSLGIEVEPFIIRRCKNKCLFCFVEQLPKGLRKSLYIKDEDYRASFLYGNYITLTNLTSNDYDRIKKMHLSPLYVSVHAVDTEIRNTLLGNYDAPPILHELKKLAKMKIRMHTQVVLCPEYNDGDVLEKTILELYKFYPYVSSLAIVPVGLTKYHKNGLKPVTPYKAEETIKIVEPLQKRFRRKHGISFVYLADEFYIRCEKPFPPIRTYDEFPQIENGVGLVPLFLYKAMKLDIPSIKTKRRFIAFTGVSFYPYLLQFVEKLKEKGIAIDLYPIKNNLFGEGVTVTGLLTGEDIIKGLALYTEPGDIILVPDVTVRDSEDMFLDNMTIQDIERILSVNPVKIGTEPEDLLETIKALGSSNERKKATALERK